MKREFDWTGDNGEYTLDTEVNAIVIPMMGLSGMSIQTDGAKAIEVFGSNVKNASESTTFVECYDFNGSAITVNATAAGVWEVNPAVFSFAKIKLVLSGGGTVYIFKKA